MFCCCGPPATKDGQSAAGGGSQPGKAQQGDAAVAGESVPAGRRKSDSSVHSLRQHSQQHLGQQVSLEPLARLGEGAALQAPGVQPAASPHNSLSASGHQQLTGQQQQHGSSQQQQRASEDGQAPQSDVLQLVALLQELLGLSTASPKQPLSKAMGLLVVRLPVDWACLHVFSASGRVVMQVRAVGMLMWLLHQQAEGTVLCNCSVAGRQLVHSARHTEVVCYAGCLP